VIRLSETARREGWRARKVVMKSNSPDRQADGKPAHRTGQTASVVEDRVEPVEAEADAEADPPILEAVQQAERMAEETGGLGRPGRPLNRRSPFFIGMTATAGVAVTVGVIELLIKAGSILILVGMALFIAAGLDPIVSWLTRHRVPRWLGVVITLLGLVGILAVFLALAIPRVTSEASALVNQLPHYAQELQNHNSELGKLNAKYHVESRLSTLISSHGSSLVGGVLSVGEVVVSAVSSFLLVFVLTVYFLGGLPRIKLFAYRLVPASRRPRTILLTDEIFSRVGGYVLGNVLTSLIIGVGTAVWMLAWGIPYPFLLAMFVALVDLIPVIGSYVGGAAVVLTALTVSLPVAIATLAFMVLYKLAEDYFIVPRVMGRTVQVPATVTLVAVLIGGTLLGIIGALVAIPVAAAGRLLLQEIAFRRLDDS
jgi:predicted PurR-regulated permease PerM